MRETVRTQVLIVGAGPVGLTLAIDLARRGVRVAVAETRQRAEAPSVKCNHISARSMEIFRRLGVASKLRDAGLPEDFPHDVVYRTTFAGTEIARIPIPSRKERFTTHGGPDTDWPTPEPPHRINQLFMEPILFEHAEATPGVTIFNRMRIDVFTQDDTGVRATGTDLDTQETVQFECDYLIGCDGGRSAVRKAIGARFQGDDVVARVQSTYIRAPGLPAVEGSGPAWGAILLNPRRSGVVFAIDGRETWLLHNYLRDDEPEFDSVDRDWAIRQMLGVGPDFEYEVLSKEDWFGRRLVADRFRDRRVFICGDASHIWIPMAGYGMNAGIADAANLAWLLAGRLDGWLAEAALAAYEAERQPITDQVSHFAMNHAVAMNRHRSQVPGDIEDDTPGGRETRAALGRQLYDLNVKQYCCGGLNFGYFYDHSPLIAYDGEAQPPYDMDTFQMSTVPGCRTPHFWLADGRSVYDAMGSDHALLRFDRAVDVDALVEAASVAGMPLRVVDVPRDDGVPAAYRHALVLSRPDQHIAWRGDALPPDVGALTDLVRGHAPGLDR
ncbi:MAG: monooxygenase [Comamonadaceae bacterium]|nr:MAG: monooxygenase [Comamonadaceae bacterium]